MAFLFAVATFAATDTPPLYTNNFEKAEEGKAPDDFLILDGGFSVKKDAGNAYLELPGAPLESYGALFGPTRKENWMVTARIFGTQKGRRFPTFGLGLDGAGGYKLQVSPAKKELELYRGDELKTSVPFEWQTGKWTLLRLSVQKTGEKKWLVSAKAWVEGSEEPKENLIKFEDSSEPPNGRAAIYGSPFATTPIRYDDLKVESTGA